LRQSRCANEATVSSSRAPFGLNSDTSACCRFSNSAALSPGRIVAAEKPACLSALCRFEAGIETLRPTTEIIQRIVNSSNRLARLYDSLGTRCAVTLWEIYKIASQLSIFARKLDIGMFIFYYD
jgi:hypothetical protein